MPQQRLWRMTVVALVAEKVIDQRPFRWKTVVLLCLIARQLLAWIEE